jgi:hypothetical protein
MFAAISSDPRKIARRIMSNLRRQRSFLRDSSIAFL